MSDIQWNQKMKLENRKQKVIAFPKFLMRLGRYALFASVLIAVSLLIGTVGYRVLCGLSWIDSFYMSSMILTGMGPVVEMDSVKAKTFSSFYALYSGVAFLSITAVFLAPIVHRFLHILHVDQTSNED